jgi:cellulose synthase/poly-beta-1,6-N-acetylglucosamine synthase-like glycosyltransferase
MEFTFWFFIWVVFYAYLGYGIVLFLMVRIKRMIAKPETYEQASLPTVAFVVPCYNEASFLHEKIKNTLSLDYPKDLIKIYFITDGSTDESNEIIQQYQSIQLLFEAKRAGKTAAENRAMLFVESEITIFCDANTTLPSNAVKELVKHYANPRVGAVSGEKRISSSTASDAAEAGEGIYWKYESFLKKYDSELLTIVGAAGELFSFRTKLFQPIATDTILDDFMLSMKIAASGYRVIYEPKAYASENSSASVKEEMKRKVRICAGGWQAIVRLAPYINPITKPLLAFEYISHRVLRWSVAPLFLFMLLPINLLLAFQNGIFYKAILVCHILFYAAGGLGWYFQKKEMKIKIFFIPYYFLMMNYAVILGFIRFIKGSQSAIWEKAQRA